MKNESSESSSEESSSEDDNDAEELDDYGVDGYHPCHVGEIIDSKYVVLKKIGWGHFSTVWLVQDRGPPHEPNRDQRQADDGREVTTGSRPRHLQPCPSPAALRRSATPSLQFRERITTVRLYKSVGDSPSSALAWACIIRRMLRKPFERGGVRLACSPVASMKAGSMACTC